MGAESDRSGQQFELSFETLLRRHSLQFTKGYEVMAMSGRRRVDFVISTRFGKLIAECKYRNPAGQIAAKRYASTGIFTVMYEYRKLFPAELMLAVVNDLGILQPGRQNYIPLLASLGVEVVTMSLDGKPDKFLQRRLEELEV